MSVAAPGLALALTVGCAPGGTAPVCMFCLAHRPCLAPSEISWALYDLTPLACFFVLAKHWVSPRYFSGGQLRVCLAMAAERLPGLGWSLRNCGGLPPCFASTSKKLASSA